MTEKKWTEGPWFAGWGGGITGPSAARMIGWAGKLPIHREPDSGEPSGAKAVVAAVHRDGPDAEANAHLMAAAPELYEELDVLCARLGPALVLALQGDYSLISEMAQETPIGYVDGEPVVRSAAMAKARGESQ